MGIDQAVAVGGQALGTCGARTGDIVDKWDGHEKWGGNGVVQILDLQDGIESYAGPGHWNDPDMLEVGNGGMTTTEYRSHFSLWCLMAAPLMAGNDLEHMSDETRSDSDKQRSDRGGSRSRRDSRQAESRKITGLRCGSNRWPMEAGPSGLLNRTGAEAEITAQWTDLGYPEHLSASVRDLWSHSRRGHAQRRTTRQRCRVTAWL